MQKSGSLGITVPLANVRHLRSCGAKAVVSARLARLGFVMPEGFCICADAYKAHLWATGVRSLARDGSRTPDHSVLRDAILRADIPPEAVSAIESAYRSLGTDVVVAVRHSASDEGTAGSAYTTVLAVQGLPSLLEAVKEVWASLWTEQAIKLRLSGSRNEPVMAVMVQVMVDSVASGIVASANPSTGNPKEVVVRSTWGIYRQGDAADESIVDLHDFRLASTRTVEKPRITLLSPDGLDTSPTPPDIVHAQSLSGSETVELAELAIWVERSLGGRSMVQWANDGSHFVILGARHLTGLPEYFPTQAMPGAWRLVDGKPASAIARSIAGAHACLHGRFYRRDDAPSPDGENAPRGLERRLARISAAARASLVGIERQTTPSIVTRIRRCARDLEFTSQWMGTMEDALPRPSWADVEFATAFQRLAAYTWQASVEYELAAVPEDIAAGIGSRYGFAFRNALDAVDPAGWTSWAEDSDQVMRLAYALARGPVNDVELGASRAHPDMSAQCRQAHALVLSALRTNLAELGRRLTDLEILFLPEDVFCLTLEEICLFQSKPPADQLGMLKQTVAHRKHEIWLDSRLDAPESFGGDPEAGCPPPHNARTLTGRTVSPGQVEAVARLAVTFDDALRLRPGEILVAEEIGPAWTPLLGLASGLVVSSDPLGVSSAAIAFRIPCAIVPGAASVIKSGQLVRVDGDGGVVEIVRKATGT